MVVVVEEEDSSADSSSLVASVVSVGYASHEKPFSFSPSVPAALPAVSGASVV